ncbi:hypothetical protein [Candidatus Berkiella aquae]|uniref:Uncharacterized protein n=1 Tax=Candidatus Berkiella aquae TaxID=295108 RepID=A0A0Q9YYF1_9GAMM|nr:hypothetical protein [Candidatus Berkiella aquae]MCS5711125.1 hypothetical protein [Candidatus Berkiella aquae]
MGDNMNDDKDKNADDQLDEFEEEFEFETEGEEEDALAPEEFETEEEEAAEPVAKEPRKNMLLPIAIAAAVVGFIGWKVVGMFTDKPEPAPAPAKPAPKVEEPAPAPAPVEKAAPQSSLPSMMDAQNVIPQEVTATEASLTKLQKKLEEQDTAIKQRLSTLEKELATANQNVAQSNVNVNKLQNDLAALNAAVQELMNQLKVIHEEREKQQQAKVSKKATATRKVESANPSLSVYAIIPGRAWLRSGSGKTITVSEGDSVGEYGKVIKIDAGNGVVITSSGVTLR